MSAKVSLEQHPEIAQAYELYQTCRLQVPYEYAYSKNKQEYRLLLPYTTGLGVLPYQGGILDQPERLMTFFEMFLAGDEHAFYTRIKKKA